MFGIDSKELEKYMKLIDKMPTLAKRAIAATLNNMAFKHKAEAANVIKEKFTVRNSAFIDRQMRVDKAKPSDEINQMQAVSASVLVDGNESFTGFEEMVTGKETRTRGPTLAGRKGQPQKILPKTSRMMKGANFPDTREMGDNLPIAAKLDILHRRGVKRFLMGGPEFPAGLYEFEAGAKTKRVQPGPSVIMVQKTENPFKKTPEKFDWPEAATERITDEWILEQYQKNLEYQIEKNFGK